MRQLDYVLLDVFTRNPLEGNQLAVFTDARSLSDADMQRLAKETNLSETTFIFPQDKQTETASGIKVRIFTVAEELPFAGHPTLGTAWYLHSQRGGDVVELDLKVGKVPVTFEPRDGALFGEMTQRDPVFGAVHDREAVSRATGLPLADIASDVPIQTVSTGMAFGIVPVASLAAIKRLSLDYGRVQAYLDKTDAKFLYFVTREPEMPGSTLHARMIFYNGEDPATGSAAGCCTGWAVHHGVLASETQGRIEQGIEAKRPSFLDIRATKTAAGVTRVRVGGNVVQVAQGSFTL